MIFNTRVREYFRRLAALLNGVLAAVAGLLGGMVCAFAACLVALYLHGVLRYSVLGLLGICVLLTAGFAVLGLVKRDYFAHFFAPVFNVFAGDGAEFSNEGRQGWVSCAATIGMFVALASLVFGALFQFFPSVATGCLLFAAYAVLAPSIYPADKEQKPPIISSNGDQPGQPESSRRSADRPPLAG